MYFYLLPAWFLKYLTYTANLITFGYEAALHRGIYAEQYAQATYYFYHDAIYRIEFLFC